MRLPHEIGGEPSVAASMGVHANQPPSDSQMLYPVATTPLLNELHGGSFSGLDRARFREQYPEIWEEREDNKLEFRFPGVGGESYQDVIQRVRPIIVELERQVRRAEAGGAAMSTFRCCVGAAGSVGVSVHAGPFPPPPSLGAIPAELVALSGSSVANG